MPNRPEPSHPEKLFCAKFTANQNPVNGVTFNLDCVDKNNIPQGAKDYISDTFGQNVLDDLIDNYPQYPQGSTTLDVTIDAPTFVIYIMDPKNWFFREDSGQPPMRPKTGQNPGNEFGPVVIFDGSGHKITAYGIFAKYMIPNRIVSFNIFTSCFQQQPVGPDHETLLIFDPELKNDG